MSMALGYDLGKALVEKPTFEHEFGSENDSKSELDAPVWGIITAKQALAYNLTYNEAAEQIKSLNGYEATIVTNEVAIRMMNSVRKPQ